MQKTILGLNPQNTQVLSTNAWAPQDRKGLSQYGQYFQSMHIFHGFKLKWTLSTNTTKI
jgi:hypothetical protein